MKILMIIGGLHKGGRERRLLELAKGLTQNGAHEVYLVCLSDVVAYPYVYELPIHFEIIPKKENDYGLIFKIRKLIRSFKPDIIHSWDVMSSGYITAANLFIHTPVVNGVIYDAAVDSSLYDRAYFKVKLYARFTKATVANSKAGLLAYKPPKRKSYCIYNGIDLKRFNQLKPADEMAMQLLGKPKGNLFIGAMVASLNKWKDHVTMLEAAIKLCEKNDRFVLFLIGDGPERESRIALVPPALLNTRIFFLGNRDDVESVLQIVDVGLLITPREGLSNAIIEYMASGKPVIASKGGGTEELVKDGDTGYLVEQKDSDRIVERVERLMEDPLIAKAMGARGRQWIEENFEISRMTENYVDLYKKIARKKTLRQIQPTE